ncbi:hypothetical protein [Priestia megaterium]
MKNVDNGTIGEIRTKAFLIDRFWILERSIDIQGADYIIQRKLSEKNILDKIPPRFGVVQVKFMQDSNTSHYIHREYILDESEEPRREFFLMLHTGNEERKRKFLISAPEIKDNFKICEKGDNIGKFYIPGNTIDNAKYEVTNNKNSLDKIEQAIKLADFASNRKFLIKTLPSFSVEEENIDYPYTLPLKNGWIDDIPREFSKLKKSLRSTMWDIEEFTNKIEIIFEKTSPLEVVKELKELLKEYGENSFNYSLWDVDIEDLEEATQRHQRKYTLLNDQGSLTNYLKIQKELNDEIIGFLEPRIESFSKNQGFSITSTYNNDLTNCKFTTKEIEKDDIQISSSTHGTLYGIIHSTQGAVTFYYFPRMYGGYKGNNWIEKINNAFDIFISPTMDEIFFNLFPQERE